MTNVQLPMAKPRSCDGNRFSSQDLSPKTAPPAHSWMLMAQKLLFPHRFDAGEQLHNIPISVNHHIHILSQTELFEVQSIERFLYSWTGVAWTHKQLLILITLVSILKPSPSYVGPHRLAWWKVRIGGGPRIPDTRRIPRDTFPPSRTNVYPIHCNKSYFR